MKSELVIFYVESDTQVAMPYLQCIGAPLVGLSVSCKNGDFRLNEDNMLDIPPAQTGERTYSAATMKERLFNQSILTFLSI